MSWREFSDLLSCLSSETPLGRVVVIRSETDMEIISKFTPAQKKMREEWRSSRSRSQSIEDYERSMQGLFAMALA